MRSNVPCFCTKALTLGALACSLTAMSSGDPELRGLRGNGDRMARGGWGCEVFFLVEVGTKSSCHCEFGQWHLFFLKKYPLQGCEGKW